MVGQVISNGGDGAGGMFDDRTIEVVESVIPAVIQGRGCRVIRVDIASSLPPGIDALQKHEKLFDALLTSLAKIEEELAEALVYADGLAQDTTRHLLDAGGKRVRPIVAVLASMLADENVRSGQVAEPTGSV